MNIVPSLRSFSLFSAQEEPAFSPQELAKALLEVKNPANLRSQVSHLKREELESCLKSVAHLVAKDPKRVSVENIIHYFDELQEKTGYEYEPPLEFQPNRADILWRILPDFIDTFLKAFNILEAGKPPQSIWDYNALIAIYVTALSFPALVVHHIFQVVALPLYAYGLSLGALSLLALSLYAYIKWLRPLPKHLPHCTSLQHEKAPPFVGREDEVKKIAGYLEAGFNVLIKGPSGVGKSSIVRAVARIIQDKKIQKIKDEVFGSGFCSSTEQLSLDFHEADNYPKQVVFYVDEIDKIMEDENLVKHLKERLRLRNFQMIGTVSSRDYNKIEKEFKSRFQVVIELKSAAKPDLKRIIKHAFKAEKIDCSDPDHWIDYLIEKSEGSEPNNALDLFELAVHQVRHLGEYDDIHALIDQKRAGLSYPCFSRIIEEQIKQKEQELPQGVKVRLDTDLIDQLVSNQPSPHSHGLKEEHHRVYSGRRQSF